MWDFSGKQIENIDSQNPLNLRHPKELRSFRQILNREV